MAKILFVTSRFPFPLDKGDKLRAFNQIKQLSQRHEVHLFSLSEERPTAVALAELEQYCTSISDHYVPRWKRLFRLPLALFDGSPFQVHYFLDKDARSTLVELCERNRPDVMHVHLVRMGPYIRTGLAPRITVDFMDCFSIGAKREATSAHFAKRILLNIEASRLARYERRTMDRVDSACIISPADRSSMPFPGRDDLCLVANGVDLGIFHPLERLKRYDVLFTGHMAYPPNIAAALYTAHEVLPALRTLRSDVTFLIAGKDAPRAIHALGNKAIDVVEEFDHIREAFAMSRVMIAPMRISIGLQNKILQAMAMGIPVVTTTQGNAAIGGEHGRHLLVADDAIGLAQCVDRLLTDGTLATSIAEQAYVFVRERFSWERTSLELERMLFPAQ